MSLRHIALCLVCLALVPGCPRDPAADASVGDARDDATGPEPFSDAACGWVVTRPTAVPGIHVPEGSPLTWPTNPPSSGDHYGLWTRWGVHNEVIPRGYYVHNLEHGGVAVLYRCDGDCSALRAQLEALIRALPPEPMCTSLGEGVPRRVVLTEDPLLDAPVAAAAWGTTYRARCLDPDSLRAFILQRTGMAPEDFCYEGSYPPPRADAGAVDASADGGVDAAAAD